MEKFIPYEKLSKKEKRKMDLAKRQTWGELNPVTRKPENSKAYNRHKARNWKRDYHEPVPGLLFILQIRTLRNRWRYAQMPVFHTQVLSPQLLLPLGISR